MRRLLSILLLACSLTSFAQTEAEWIRKADAAEAALNENAAFEGFKQAIRLNPNNLYSQWKASELCSRLGKRQPTKEQQRAFYVAGKTYAANAIRINPNAADGYYAMSVAMGRLALSQSGRERINSVKDIRTYAEKAIRINPRHGRAWHVLGKWHYEVTNLGFFEKAGLKIIYGGLPPASLQESIQCYEKAKQFEPVFALNYLELAKAYRRNDQKDKAIELLRKLPSIPNKTADDAHIKSEGAKLLKELLEN
jgi:tetratricopeptide (TPR) repeat protein